MPQPLTAVGAGCLYHATIHATRATTSAVLPALDTADRTAYWQSGFPWLSEIVMPAEKRDAPFVLAEHQRGTQRTAAVNIAAEACDLHTGMALADARALVHDMRIEMLDPARGAAALDKCARWLRRYTPWVGATRIPIATACCSTPWLRTFVWRRTPRARRHASAVQPSGITCCIAVADTIGSAWALAHYGPDSLIIARPAMADAVMDLPPGVCPARRYVRSVPASGA